jgi:hypothetical protein
MLHEHISFSELNITILASAIEQKMAREGRMKEKNGCASSLLTCQTRIYQKIQGRFVQRTLAYS